MIKSLPFSLRREILAAGGHMIMEFSPNPENLSENDKRKLGFNTSSIHTDMISTTPRTGTATLADGSQIVIYKNGEFQV